MIISQSPQEIQSAIALQLKVELARIALRDCRASNTASEVDVKGPVVISVAHASSVKHPIKEFLQIEVSFKIRGVDSATPSAEIFSIECSFNLDYRMTDPSFKPLEESILAFKEGNAVFNCWPYTREFIQNITSRMAINTPPLPFLRITPKQQEAPLAP
jgi:hypothetical protein